MFSRLKPPGGDRTLFALLMLGGGLYFLFGGVTKPSYNLTILGALGTVVGSGLWFRKGWARWGAIVLLLALAVFQVWHVAKGTYGAWRLLLAGFSVFWAWNVWRHFDPRKQSDPPGGDKKDGPLTSFVLLVREPRFLDAAILARAVSASWGGTYTGSDAGSETPEDPANAGFVVGHSPFFVLKSPEAVYMVHNLDRPYFDDPTEAAARMPELRSRRAIEQNRGWIAVDLMAPHDVSRPRESFYPAIARLIAQLAGDDCVAIYHPESGRFNAWDPALEEKLKGPHPLDDFARPVNPPVVGVDDDDPRMRTAVEEARRRWPEFVDAFNARAGEHFSIKAPITAGDRTEFIWVTVAGLEPECIHGTLGNDPVDLGGMKLGDRIEVPLKDLNDWAFARGKEMFGLFTVKVVDEIRKKTD